MCLRCGVLIAAWCLLVPAAALAAWGPAAASPGGAAESAAIPERPVASSGDEVERPRGHELVVGTLLLVPDEPSGGEVSELLLSGDTLGESGMKLRYDGVTGELQVFGHPGTDKGPWFTVQGSDGSATLSAGGSTVTIDPSGAITIKGVSVTVRARSMTLESLGSMTLSARSDLSLSATTVGIDASTDLHLRAMNLTSQASMKNTVKGTMTSLEASAINTVKGGVVKIN